MVHMDNPASGYLGEPLGGIVIPLSLHFDGTDKILAKPRLKPSFYPIVEPGGIADYVGKHPIHGAVILGFQRKSVVFDKSDFRSNHDPVFQGRSVDRGNLGS
jgi:hypothetical protein